MTPPVDEMLVDVRSAVRALCEDFPESYWRGLEPDTYPAEFVEVLTRAGWLSLLIPIEYGGGGGSFAMAAAVLEEINASGCNAASCHAQMYTMGVLLRHGSEAQRAKYLPGIAAGDLRLQSFGVTEPEAGSDTTQIRTFAKAIPGGYLVNGQKVFISRALHSDLMILLARTTPAEAGRRDTDGLSLFLVDLASKPDGLDVRSLPVMINHGTCEIFFDDVFLPQDALIGTEGRGFYHLLDGLNAERILIASECVGDGRFFIRKAVDYAKTRRVFGRPIGANQGVQFPLAQAHANLLAASMVRDEAARKFDAGQSCGAEANTAKLLASQASWAAADACMDTFGGWGFANESGVERKWREARLYRTAPIHNNLVLSFLATKVLSLPRSY